MASSTSTSGVIPRLSARRASLVSRSGGTFSSMLASVAGARRESTPLLDFAGGSLGRLYDVRTGDPPRERYFFASGCQFIGNVIGAGALSSTVLIRKRSSGQRRIADP